MEWCTWAPRHRHANSLSASRAICTLRDSSIVADKPSIFLTPSAPPVTPTDSLNFPDTWPNPVSLASRALLLATS